MSGMDGCNVVSGRWSRRRVAFSVAVVTLIAIGVGLIFWRSSRPRQVPGKIITGTGVNLNAGIVGRVAPAPPVVPLHQRPDYRVNAPDILRMTVTAKTPGDSTRFSGLSREYLVDADGCIDLGPQAGKLSVEGMTTAEIQAAVEHQLSAKTGDATATVAVSTPNSKVFYVITNESGADRAWRLPYYDGQENVQKAIAQTNVQGNLANSDIWVARPAPGSGGCDMILPVDWQEITSGPGTTNHTLLPGDRVFIQPRPTIWQMMLGHAKHLLGV